MDYRHTEDFARQMEAAGLRARALRAEAIAIFWGSIFSAISGGFRALRRWLAGARRVDKMLPRA